MRTATFILWDEKDRRFALRAVQIAPLKAEVRVGPRQRTSQQNRLLWSLLSAIVDAKTELAGRQWDEEDWYEILASTFLRQKGLETGKNVQGLSGEFLTLGRIRPSKFNVEMFSEWTTSVLAFIDERGIPWKERAKYTTAPPVSHGVQLSASRSIPQEVEK